MLIMKTKVMKHNKKKVLSMSDKSWRKETKYQEEKKNTLLKRRKKSPEDYYNVSNAR